MKKFKVFMRVVVEELPEWAYPAILIVTLFSVALIGIVYRWVLALFVTATILLITVECIIVFTEWIKRVVRKYKIRMGKQP